MNQDELHRSIEEDAFPPAPPISPVMRIFRNIETRSSALDALLNDRFTSLFEKVLEYEAKKAQMYRVDGLIIGTGEADFTKKNEPYPLKYKGKSFQLIDVPGIEGDESKYAPIVRSAIAKAHLVFYVNGTNKKPEKATAEKIRSYLRWGTKVCPLINIRGSADAYEFDEDRKSLIAHSESASALNQTQEVLRSVLGDKALQAGFCVQGLIAFSALSEMKGRTTIHSSRSHDLLIQQKNYKKYFSSSKEMYEFSQIKEVAKVLHNKLSTFQEEMIESNKAKVLELLSENVSILEKMYATHKDFVARTEPEFKKCREEIENGWVEFERSAAKNRKSLWNKFFVDLKDVAGKIVEKNIGNAEAISKEIDKKINEKFSSLKVELQKQFEECLGELQDNLTKAASRLLKDVERVGFEQSLYSAGAIGIDYNTSELDLGLKIGDYGWMVFNVASYAINGTMLGSAFPVIGNLAGAVLGTLVGLLLGLISSFIGKEKRIRTAQEKVHKTLDEARERVFDSLESDDEALFGPVREHIDKVILVDVQKIDESLRRPLKVIENQMKLMTRTKKQLENMPYGTIQAI